MRNSGRRSREGAAKTSDGGKGNATDGDDDDDDDEEEEDGEDDDDVAVCAEGTSSGTVSVVEAIVKQKVLDEVCSANVLPFFLLILRVQIAVLNSVGRGAPARPEHLGGAV